MNYSYVPENVIQFISIDLPPHCNESQKNSIADFFVSSLAFPRTFNDRECGNWYVLLYPVTISM